MISLLDCHQKEMRHSPVPASGAQTIQELDIVTGDY
jgi:hypothetical protein